LPTLPIARVIPAFLAAVFALGPATASAQDTREGIITSEEAAKAANPPPKTETTAEIVLDRVGQVLDPKPRGPFPYFDSVYGGGGFTIGAGYGWTYGDKGTILARGLYSIKNYKLIEGVTISPGHLTGRLLFSGVIGWRQATDAPFYGRGMDTSQSDRADFDMKETYASATAVLRPTKWSVFEGTEGLEAYVIGPGGSGERSVEGDFTPETAPGIGTDPNYVHSEGTAGIDWRNSPGYSRTGGYYAATIHNYTNTNGPYDFNRVDLESIQHVPILRETWVLSFRGRVQTTVGTADNTPYFLLPSLGSGSTLRAYHSYRFRDRNSLLTQAEFRWIPNRLGLDMAIFYDAGKVAARRQDLNFVGMAHDWGVGVRLHGPVRTPLRIELARGSEGFNFLFSAGPSF
jgi:hypothetical protein